MKGKTKSGLILAAGMIGALFCYAEARSIEVLWLDFDMKAIPEPKERPNGYYDYFFKNQLIEATAKETLDVPRWVRRAIGHPKQAANVNALDEAPDSSWYTNRHHLHRMTIEQLVRGPDRGKAPDFTNAVITKAKTEGAEPGMWMKDATGQLYLVKFDGVDYPGLQSGAEVVSTKILYAAGYYVPENYVAYVDAASLKIGENAQTVDAKTGRKRALTRDDIDLMMRRVARMSDGRYRGMASKMLPGKPKGPFPQMGLRMDDPNDLIPHEDRRELRGLRAIASWINHWDMKEPQSLDMYVEQDGRKFLRHYLLDFGSTLGADDMPTDYYHGREYGLDLKNIGKEILTLGFRESPDEKTARLINSEVGSFTSDDFDPGTWRPTFPTVMFDNMTDQDAFWATRVILSFTEEELKSIVEAGQYADSKSVDYILRTLLERRQMVARYWLRKVDGLSDFHIQPTSDGVAMTFHDLMVDNNFTRADSAEYTYEVKGARYRSGKKKNSRPEIRIDRESLGAAVERGNADAPIEVTIWVNRQNATPDPVRVYFDWNPNREAAAVRRISRG